jgi:hypothetical protein
VRATLTSLLAERLGGRRIYLVVGAVALVVYLGALGNRFAMDDIPLVARNPLVQSISGVWRAFAAPYWPPDFGGHMYRPLAVATWALDQRVGGTPWFHLVSVMWHVGVCIAVVALVRWVADDRSALIAGLLFAVHPVHVEAVANVVGRTELMAALFVMLGVYPLWLVAASRGRPRPGPWRCSARRMQPSCRRSSPGAGSSASDGRRAVACSPSPPAGWWWRRSTPPCAGRFSSPMRGFNPSRRRSWRLPVHPSHGRRRTGRGSSPAARLTLRVDYSPTSVLVVSLFDLRLLAGLACFLAWATLLALAWRRGRALEALGLGWIGIAFLPVANLVFPAGFFLAERTLYLPSVGLALAAGSWLARWPASGRLGPAAILVLLGGVRTAQRVPTWRDNTTVTLSILEDSPRSYVGPKRMVAVYLNLHQPDRALDAARQAARINGRDPTLFVTAAVAAFAAGRPAAADSLLSRLEGLCPRCLGYYHQEAAIAREHGYAAAADSLEARARARSTVNDGDGCTPRWRCAP